MCLLTRFGRPAPDQSAGLATFWSLTSSDLLTYKKIHYRCYNLLRSNMDQTGTIRTSDWKDGFLFVGNQVALDFVNTRPVQNGEPMELLPDFPALLRWFQAASLLSARDVGNLRQKWGKSARAQRTVEAFRELREKLRKEILAWEGGSAVHHSTVDELNRLMADHPMRTKLKTSGRASTTELWFEPRQP